MELFTQNITQVKEGLVELENLFNEGKDRNDTKVRDLEDNIRTSLNIPRESWIKTDQTLRNVIETLHKQLSTVQNATIPHEMIPDKDVLRNASGGLALEGVFKTRNPEDLLVKREQVIESPDSFTLTSPNLSTICEQREFSSHKSEKAFHKIMERLGYSFRSSFNTTGSLGLGAEKKKSTETEDPSLTSQEESCVIQIKYNYIPLACGVFQKETLRLSTAAIQALTIIETVNKPKMQTNLVRRFFERFGSHVHQGPLHFGGLFGWRASASGFIGTDLSEVKKLTSEALDIYCGGFGFGVLPVSGEAATPSTHLSESLTGKHREDLINQVQLSVSKMGGPAEIDNHLLWKSHLVTNNRTWTVIDKGTNLIPVWEIVMTSHRHDFEDVFKLIRILMDAYKEITGEHVEEVWEESILSHVDKAEALMHSVQTWSARDCESYLKRLLNFKTKLFEETGSHKMWLQKCISNKRLQKYLFEVANEATAVNLRFMMRSLLKPDLYKVENFENRRQIVNWAYQTEEDPNEIVSVSDFSELDRVFQFSKQELHDSKHTFSSPEQNQSAHIKATNTVTLALNSLYKTLRDPDQEEAKLLILSIITVIGYSGKSKTFSHLLGIKEITFLQSELHNAFSKYSCLREQCPIRAQAYLLLTALTVSSDKDTTISAAEKEERLRLILTESKEKLSSPIKSVLEEMQNDWESLEKALNSIILGRQEETGSRDWRGEEVEGQLEGMVRRLAPLPELPKTDEHHSNSPVYDINGKSRSFMDLLQKIGLQDSYPKQLTKTNALVIDRLSLSVEEPKTEKDLSSHYLYKLMMLDYRARYLFVKPEVSMDLVEDIINDDGDDFFDCEDNSDFLVCSKVTHIHPMDVHMAIFHCSSDFLRQYIYTKLSACQFGLPFLVLNPCTEEVEFPLWPLRHIRKSWHSKAQTASGSSRKYYNQQMFNTAVPIISFIRLGVSDFNSKSQILNNVINKQKHPVFFNRHCKGSAPDSLLMNGVVEIAWYCPGGKEDDIFDDCVAFLNLHGDAAEHPKQLDFLQAVSTVNVLLLSEHPMSERAKEISQRLSKSPVPLICLFSGKDKIQPSKNSMKVRLAAKNRNQADFTEQLVSSIKQCISEYKQTASLDRCLNEARRQQFIVDEDKHSSQEGRRKAQELMDILSDICTKDNVKDNLPNLKETILPLQGKLWHDWSKTNKERYRLKIKENRNIEMHLAEILSKMKHIRQMQIQKANPLNDFMKSLLEFLITPEQFEDTHLYLLQWLVILLDDLTSNELALLEVDYDSTWKKMKSLPKGRDKALNAPLQNRLNEITDKMAATTVGIQHVMREVNQLYEATHTSRKAHRNTYSTLPQIGATMLISGYPLEIMDGDAAHVPLVWIQAVLEELIKTLGDKKVFVLSILGIQSSGKSTLLNTMFGLQFAVSAGRCTRGAFMQLLKVNENISNELGYDFVLIVDTEGLRSPELSTKISLNHDNELATFIIGIGDVTLINIMGENPSEMQDILQICVQAFLRMKQVKITPSCIFVHQNVADSSAGDQNAEGRRRLLEKLDEMAEMAAKEENVDGITCFSDVIQFDIETQVFYFKNLLEGDPPMAPINPSYSHNVQQLKTKLLTVAAWQEKCQFSTLSEFKCRVSDLWMALLQENFVFSFKNTVELMVYNSLEHNYSDWSWKLRKHSQSLQTKMENQIGSNLIQDMCLVNLTEEFVKVYNPLETEIEKYFSEDKNKETLIKWKANIEARFTSLKKELIEGIMKKGKDLLTAKQNRSELDQKRAKYRDQLTMQSKRLAAKLKTQYLTDDKMREEFDKLWIKWTADVMDTQPTEEPLNVKGIVENILLKRFHNQSKINQKVKEGKFEFDPEIHIMKQKRPPFICWPTRKGSFYCRIEVIQGNADRAVNEYITRMENERKDFDKHLIHEILTDIEKMIAEFERKPENPRLTKEFKVDLSVNLCLKNITRLQKMHEELRNANHPLTYFQSQRETYFQLFENDCKGASCVTIFVDFLCTHITPEVGNTAYNKTCREIADRVKNNDPALNGNRSNLESHILRDLATQENFSLYVEYIDDPQCHFERFIDKKVMKFCSDDNTVHTVHQNNLESLKNQIFTASLDVTTEVSEKKGNASLWLDLFCGKVGELIVIQRDDLRSIEKEDINDWQFLKDTMATSLEEMIKDVKIDMRALKLRSTSILFPQLQGCWAQCPFCNAICTNTIPNHDGDHSIQFHRSRALTGMHWNETDQFSIDFCTASVISNDSFKPPKMDKWIPFKTYRSAGDPYNKWSITGDGSSQCYWKWFLCKFQSEWEKKYDFKFTGKGQLPSEWETYEKEDALKELE